MLKRAIQAMQSARGIRAYQHALQKQPLLTQVCTGSVLVVIGDGLAQHLVEHTQKHDYERSARMVLLRGVIHSTFIIYWYRALNRFVALPGTTLNKRLAVQYVATVLLITV